MQKNLVIQGWLQFKPHDSKKLKRSGIKPFKIKYYCEKRDSDFESQIHDGLVVYKQVEMQLDENGNIIVPTGGPMVHTVSYDEKFGIQAKTTTGDDFRPTAEKGCVYRGYEYKRLGTLSFIGGIDLLTGIAVPVVSETHKSSDFSMLFEKLDNMYPEGDIIRIIWDKHSIHQSKEVWNYLIMKLEGRYVFVSSWRNLIKCY